tara:strand:- start:6844 stop:7266 length:423 start_codon:yes stop_codon:yes gene_type:complete
MKTEIKNKCHFCKSEEGKPRPVGNYIVELKTMNVHGAKKLVCQSCHHKIARMLTIQKQESMKPSKIARLQQFLLKMTGMIFMFAVGTITVFAQGTPGLPMFPDEPAAAPIDGGLSLLAAAGGAYAYKKLKGRKADSKIEE